MRNNLYCWWPSRSLLPSWFWSSQPPQSDQRSALPCIYEFWHSLCTTGGKRPDGVTLVPWKRGRCLAWDATCPDTYPQSAIHESSVQAGSVALKAELNKWRKYADTIAGLDFTPFAIETSGVWVVQATELVSEIGRRLTSTTHEPRSTTFLHQRISVAVMRGNAQCVLGTLQSSNCCDV